MADLDSQRTGAAEIICAAATVACFYVAVPYLGGVTGMLDWPGFFAYWRWVATLRVFALGAVLIICQAVVLAWSRRRGFRADLAKLTLYASVYWLLLCGLGPGLYRLSRVYPLRMYVGGAHGLAGPAWAARHRPARAHVKFPPALKMNPRNGGPAGGPGGRKR